MGSLRAYSGRLLAGVSALIAAGPSVAQGQDIFQADNLQVLSCRTIKYPAQVTKGSFQIPAAPISVYGAAWRGYEGARWPSDIKFTYGASAVIQVETNDQTTLFSVGRLGELDLSGRSTERRYQASRLVSLSDADRASLTADAKTIIGGLGGSQFVCPPRDAAVRARVEARILSELGAILSERQRACESYIRETRQLNGGNEFVRVAHISGRDGKSVLKRENFAWQKQSYGGPGISGGASCTYAPTIFNQFRCEICSDTVLRDVLRPER